MGRLLITNAGIHIGKCRNEINLTMENAGGLVFREQPAVRAVENDLDPPDRLGIAGCLIEFLPQ